MVNLAPASPTSVQPPTYAVREPPASPATRVVLPGSIEQLFEVARTASEAERPALLRRAAKLLEKQRKK